MRELLGFCFILALLVIADGYLRLAKQQANPPRPNCRCCGMCPCDDSKPCGPTICPLAE